MQKKFDLGEIKKHWIRQALKYGQSYEVSWSDRYAIELEIKEILKYLKEGDNIVDVGCGNGYSTLRFVFERKINIKGIDYVSEMIKNAKLKIKRPSRKFLGKADFCVGNIMKLDEPSGAYDKVIAIRTIINLGAWNLQLKGLKECIRVLRSGGMLLFSEATLQGWQQLNKIRRECGLPSIPMPFFNYYLDQGKVVKALSSDLQLIDIVNFSSTYYIGTRVFKPLLVKLTGAKVDVADPDAEWNRWFAQLPPWGDYGIQKLFIFKKL